MEDSKAMNECNLSNLKDSFVMYTPGLKTQVDIKEALNIIVPISSYHYFFKVYLKCHGNNISIQQKFLYEHLILGFVQVYGSNIEEMKDDAYFEDS